MRLFYEKDNSGKNKMQGTGRLFLTTNYFTVLRQLRPTVGSAELQRFCSGRIFSKLWRQPSSLSPRSWSRMDVVAQLGAVEGRDSGWEGTDM